MMECKDIEKHLPLYDEGLLSGKDQKAVEEHLAVCEKCRRELSCLRKTVQLLENLPPVEEPAWFQQKIMAGVRKAANKRSIMQKWFYPLRIKIPMQIMATIVIAVLTVYLYRSGDEEARRILSRAAKPALEIQKDQSSTKKDKSADIASTPLSRPKPGEGSLTEQSGQTARESLTPKSEKPFKFSGSTSGKQDHKETFRQTRPASESKDMAAEANQSGLHSSSVALEEIPQREKLQKRPSTGMGKSRPGDMPAAPSVSAALSASPPKAIVLLQVQDLNTAAAHVERILVEHNARKVTRHTEHSLVRLSANLYGRDWQKVLSELNEKGTVKEMLPAGTNDDFDIAVIIEISEK